MINRRELLAGAAASAAVFSAGRARAADAAGVTDKEIKIGRPWPL